MTLINGEEVNDQCNSIDCVSEIVECGPNLKILPSNDQVKELQTILRDK